MPFENIKPQPEKEKEEKEKKEDIVEEIKEIAEKKEIDPEELKKHLEKVINILQQEPEEIRPKTKDRETKEIRPGGLVKIPQNTPVLVIPPLGGRLDFLLKILQSKDESGKTILEKLEEGNIQVISLGGAEKTISGLEDVKKEKRKGVLNIFREYQEQLNSGKITEDDLDRIREKRLQEKKDNFFINNRRNIAKGTLALLLLKEKYPRNFHYLAGDYEHWLTSTVASNFYRERLLDGGRIKEEELDQKQLRQEIKKMIFEESEKNPQILDYLDNWILLYYFGPEIYHKYLQLAKSLPIAAGSENYIISSGVNRDSFWYKKETDFTAQHYTDDFSTPPDQLPAIYGYRQEYIDKIKQLNYSYFSLKYPYRRSPTENAFAVLGPKHTKYQEREIEDPEGKPLKYLIIYPKEQEEPETPAEKTKTEEKQEEKIETKEKEKESKEKEEQIKTEGTQEERTKIETEKKEEEKKPEPQPTETEKAEEIAENKREESEEKIKKEDTEIPPSETEKKEKQIEERRETPPIETGEEGEKIKTEEEKREEAKDLKQLRAIIKELSKTGKRFKEVTEKGLQELSQEQEIINKRLQELSRKLVKKYSSLTPEKKQNIQNKLSFLLKKKEEEIEKSPPEVKKVAQHMKEKKGNLFLDATVLLGYSILLLIILSLLGEIKLGEKITGIGSGIKT